jgi:divalent metal cation (Fe/Co/Zn/Cd) transporter
MRTNAIFLCNHCHCLVSAFNSAATAFMALGLLASTFAQRQNDQVWFLDSIIAISIAFVIFVYGLR